MGRAGGLMLPLRLVGWVFCDALMGRAVVALQIWYLGWVAPQAGDESRRRLFSGALGRLARH